MKLKYYLLGGLITLLGVVNITNAESITFRGVAGVVYTPNTITIPEGQFQGFSNLSYTPTEEKPDAMIVISENTTDDPDNACYVGIYSDGEIQTRIDFECVAGNQYQVYIPEEMSESYGILQTITLNFEDTNTGGGTGGGTEGEGGNEGENTGTNIVAGGVNAFSGIIERLGNIFKEFGPLIIYIALACLGISMAYKMLKEMLSYTNNQCKNSISGRAGMQERRRRRRQQRRKTYTFNQARNDKGNSNYYSTPNTGKLYKRSWKVQKGYIKNNGGF